MYVSRPDRPGPGVVLLHAWWGLTADFTNLCDQLAAAGYWVAAPDLHGGRVAATIPEAEQLVECLPEETRLAGVAAAAQWLREQPGVQPRRVALIGFSLGAAFALRAAARGVGDAVVIYYGTGLQPGARIRQPVLGHFAEVDEYEPAADVSDMFEGLTAGGTPATLRVYPGTGHWFAEESSTAYDQPAAAKAWTETLQFLQRHLQ